MITKDRQLAEILTIKDVQVILNNLDATLDWYWHHDSISRPDMQSMDVWNVRQKKFVKQILASITDKLAFHKKAIERMSVEECADSLDLPESFIKKVKMCLIGS